MCGRLVLKAADVPQGFNMETQSKRGRGSWLLVLLTGLLLTEERHGRSKMMTVVTLDRIKV